MLNNLGELFSLDNLSARPCPITALAIQSLVVAQARLPSILAVLMYSKGVVHGATLYSKSVQATCGMGLPTPLVAPPCRIEWDITLAVRGVMHPLFIGEPIELCLC